MNELMIANFENTSIASWDFDRIKTELTEALRQYEDMVYTDESIKSAKNDKSTLNKLKKAIEDARKAYKKHCLAPYDEIEPKVKELVEIVEKQWGVIDSTVKEFEQRQKDAKEIIVRAFYDRKAKILGELAEVLYSKLLNKSWLNASVSRAKYEKEITDAVNKAYNDIEAIKALNSPFEDKLLKLYVETLSVDAVREKNEELCEATKDAVKAVTNTQVTTERIAEVSKSTDDTVVIKITATDKQKTMLFDYMKAIGISYETL